MVVKEEIKDEINKDEDYLTFGGLLASEISTDVFKGKKVEVHYCDENLETLKVCKMIKIDEEEVSAPAENSADTVSVEDVN